MRRFRLMNGMVRANALWYSLKVMITEKISLPLKQTSQPVDGYSPVILLPKQYTVFDFSAGDLDTGLQEEVWGVGKYNEKRRDVYRQFYHKDRDIHLGVDLFGPVGTEVHAFADGEIYMTSVNPDPGDYGATIICKHQLIGGGSIYALYGHLSRSSLESKMPGQKIHAGDVIAWTGERSENGGWASHVHFQLAWKAPESCDMPGVVSDEHIKDALNLYPDPRTFLGQIF
jgi:murein DD-endopeptidase MepM/ murein hydrolase activator NlpD